MTDLIAGVFSLFLFALGMSLLIQTRCWLDYARTLAEDPGKVMFLSLLLLPMGLVIVIGHNIWVWEWRVVVTILGWGMTIKYALYLVYPKIVGYFEKWLERDLTGLVRAVALLYAAAGAASAWQVLGNQTAG